MNKEFINKYYFTGTDILKNKLNIYNSQKLQKVEAQLVMYKMQLLDQVINISYHNEFSQERLKAIHHFLYDDIYAWAGEFRESNFHEHRNVYDNNLIRQQMKTIMKYYNSSQWENEKIDKTTKLEGWTELLYGLWNIQAFKEGNTLSSVAFSLQFAKFVGLELNKEYFLEKAEYLRECLCLYDQGHKNNLRSFVFYAFTEGEEIEPNQKFMKEMTIRDLQKNINEWIETYEDPVIKNYLQVNSNVIVREIANKSYTNLEMVKNEFNAIVDHIVNEQMEEDYEESEDMEME